MNEFNEILTSISQNIRPVVSGLIWGMMLVFGIPGTYNEHPLETRFGSRLAEIFSKFQQSAKRLEYTFLGDWALIFLGAVWFFLVGPLIALGYTLGFGLIYLFGFFLIGNLTTLVFWFLGKNPLLGEIFVFMGVFAPKLEWNYEPSLWFTAGIFFSWTFLGILLAGIRIFFIRPVINLVKNYGNLPSRTIALDYVGNQRITTIFFGDLHDPLDWAEYSSEAYKTLVCNANGEEVVKTYSSWSAAKEGHEKVVKEL